MRVCPPRAATTLSLRRRRSSPPAGLVQGGAVCWGVWVWVCGQHMLGRARTSVTACHRMSTTFGRGSGRRLDRLAPATTDDGRRGRTSSAHAPPCPSFDQSVPCHSHTVTRLRSQHASTKTRGQRSHQGAEHHHAVHWSPGRARRHGPPRPGTFWRSRKWRVCVLCICMHTRRP
jgi:hypothetical protein